MINEIQATGELQGEGRGWLDPSPRRQIDVLVVIGQLTKNWKLNSPNTPASSIAQGRTRFYENTSASSAYTDHTARGKNAFQAEWSVLSVDKRRRVSPTAGKSPSE